MGGGTYPEMKRVVGSTGGSLQGAAARSPGPLRAMLSAVTTGLRNGDVSPPSVFRAEEPPR